MLPLRRLLIISRPLLYIPSVAVFLYGFVYSGSLFSVGVLIGILLFTLPLNLIVFGINDITDRESDARNPRKGGMYGTVLNAAEAGYLRNVIISTLILGTLLLMITNNYPMLVPVAAIFVFAYVYSVRPFRLKSWPVLDSLSNGLWIASMFMAGYWAAPDGAELSLPPIRLLAAIVLCAAAYHAFTTVMDYAVDKKNGDMTIGVVLGPKLTLCVCALFYIVCSLLVGLRNTPLNLYLWLSALLCLTGLRYDSPVSLRRICDIILFLLLPTLVGAIII